ncbi:MAG: DUF2281 domain-containing protein [Treponemataceae bacterium]|nr:DUF2281 domain-containing protein [Treponemataceae bacterium]
MSYDVMIEQIKSMPQECLADLENYIEYIMYKYNLPSQNNSKNDKSQYFGSVKFNKDALELQKEMPCNKIANSAIFGA